MSDNGPDATSTGTIIAPVSRHLSVCDLARSLAFYRDVLGFTVRELAEGDGLPAEAEAVLGPARIQLTTSDVAYDSQGGARPQGSAMLFFKTDNLDAVRDGQVARGGTPSAIEKVNWIKYRMFVISDPDGHQLWFAQSYQYPTPPPDPNRQCRKALPQMPLDDVLKGVDYYRDCLGFEINHQQGDLAVMFRDDVVVLLIARTDRHKGIGSCYIYINSADDLHAELLARGARVEGEPISHPWGLRDFAVLDLEGNQIWFGETFE